MATKRGPASFALGSGLTEPVYDAILAALAEEPGRLDVLIGVLHPSDIAVLLERLPYEHRHTIIHRVPPEKLGEVIANVAPAVQESLLEELTTDEVAQALDTLESDDVADIVQNMDDDQADKALDIIPEIQQALLNYPEDTAGGLMQLEVVAVPPNWTVDRLFTYLRTRTEDIPENIATVYVVDPTRRLIGSVSLSRLMRATADQLLSDVMRTDPVTLLPETPQRDVTRLFEKYDLYACAVVDRDQRLLGRITIDDVLDAVVAQSEHEILGAAGLSEGEDLFAPVPDTTRSRLPWLVINLLTAVLASMVVALFEGKIQEIVALAVLMPIVASMGGNAGTQTLTVLVRGLATGLVTHRNAWYLLKKEMAVGSFNGLVLGVMLSIGTALIYSNMALAAVIFAATVLTHLFAALAGHLIPIVLHRLKKDPAISAGVFMTTVTDVMGFFSFLGLAALFL